MLYLQKTFSIVWIINKIFFDERLFNRKRKMTGVHSLAGLPNATKSDDITTWNAETNTCFTDLTASLAAK